MSGDVLNELPPEPGVLAENLFTPRNLSSREFRRTLIRLTGSGDAPNGDTWGSVVSDFSERTDPALGEIGRLYSKTDQMRYGYYGLVDAGGHRLGNVAAIVIPEAYWQQKGEYLDKDIGAMLIKIMDLSAKTAVTDEDNRIKVNPETTKSVANVIPIQEFVVPRIKIKDD